MLGNLCSKRKKFSVGKTGWHLFSLSFWNKLALKCDKMCSIISPRYQNTWRNTKFRTLALNTTRVGPDRVAWLWYSCSGTTVSFLSKLWKVKMASGFNIKVYTHLAKRRWQWKLIPVPLPSLRIHLIYMIPGNSAAKPVECFLGRFWFSFVYREHIKTIPYI